MENKLLDILKEMGIFIDEDEKDDDLNLDSFTFISMITEIERSLDITIPDELLLKDSMSTFNQILSAIKKCC